MEQEKIKQATLFRKVDVDERLPEKAGTYLTNMGREYFNETYKHFGSVDGIREYKVDYWLEEVELGVTSTPPSVMTSETLVKEVAPTEEKPEYFIWDGINGDFCATPSLDKGEKTIRSWIAEDEDIHPDAESVFILQKISVPILTRFPITFKRFSATNREGWVKVEDVEKFWEWVIGNGYKNLSGTMVFIQPEGIDPIKQFLISELYDLFKSK